jgi:hypothetical protein
METAHEKIQFKKLYRNLAVELKAKPNRLVRFFPEVNLRNGHEGLALIARDHRINVAQLQPGEYVVFLNKAQTALKMFAPGNVVAHLKMPYGKINPEVIALIPRFFQGGRIDYHGALSEVIRKAFPEFYQFKLKPGHS